MDACKSIWKRMIEAVSKAGLWIIIVYLIGIVCGGFAMQWYQQQQMQEAKTLGAFIFEKQVYEMKVRP